MTGQLIYRRHDHVTDMGDRRFGLDVDASIAEVVDIEIRPGKTRKDRVIKTEIDGIPMKVPVRRAMYVPDDQCPDTLDTIMVPVEEVQVSHADTASGSGSAAADLGPVARMAAAGDREGLIAHFLRQEGIGEKRAKMLADATLSG